MLRITVELLPYGDAQRARVLAKAFIWNKGRDKKGYRYGVHLTESGSMEPPSSPSEEHAEIRNYPRWSASIWDLVARALHRGMAPASRGYNLGPLPKALIDVVPVRTTADGLTYIRLADIPEFARPHFERFLCGQTCPLIESEPDPAGCAYVHDFHRFLGL